MTEDVQCRRHDGYVEIRLARPAKRNAITQAMYGAMADALAAAADDPAIACVLIAADGDVFCAGNDLADFLVPGGAEAALRFIQAIAAFPKPIVAAVGGPAVGVGTTMLLHCRLVYATPAARFTVPFASLGIVPEAASSLLLPRIVGEARAAAMLLLGEPMGAQEAAQAGLVTALVEAGTLDAHAHAKVAKLAAMPPQALAATHALVRGDRAEIDARILLEAERLREALAGDEMREAVAAFFEKRAPDFGRRAT